MDSLRLLIISLALFAGLLSLPMTTRAETYDTCAGFIDSLPATISTQGVWCLRKDLTTAIGSGNAIEIVTNNVTIDCNNFKIGGLAAGTWSMARGIYAENRLNSTIRECSIRGFFAGIYLNGGAGHLVENNRLDQNLLVGIQISGDNNRVRRNAVYDTGGAENAHTSTGIHAAADIIDNTVAGVFAWSSTATYPRGITVFGSGNVVRGNNVRGLVVAGQAFAVGIYAGDPGIRLTGNHVSAEVATPGAGIQAASSDAFCTENTVVNFANAYAGCTHQYANLPAP